MKKKEIAQVPFTINRFNLIVLKVGGRVVPAVVGEQAVPGAGSGDYILRFENGTGTVVVFMSMSLEFADRPGWIRFSRKNAFPFPAEVRDVMIAGKPVKTKTQFTTGRWAPEGKARAKQNEFRMLVGRAFWEQ